MANDPKKYLDDNGLLYFWGKLKALFSGKVDKVDGKGLSTNDFTNTLKSKLDGIAEGAEANVNADWNAASGDAQILNKPSIPSPSSITPAMDGTASAGSSTSFARGDHVHPHDSNKADVATTLAGYGITDAYTKNEVDAKVSSVYKPAGSVATVAALGTLTAANEGKVYNFTASFTTTSDFVEGAGSTYPAGTNVVIVNTASSGNAVYKYDVLAGFVDLSGYLQTTDITEITNSEIDTIVAS